MRNLDPLSIVVVGASGDLARKKIYPALFALFSQGYLPPLFHIFGLARSDFSHEGFRTRVAEHLTCRYEPRHACQDRMQEFLSRCYYVRGAYDSRDTFLDLFSLMSELETGAPTHRLYYLAIPPSVFMDVARSIGNAGFVSCDPGRPWSRVVIEKPFGRDRASSDQLTREMAQVFTEEQTYRIDHYLGKEVVQNLLVLRFANRVFEPLWNRDHIESVRIDWCEDLAVGERGGYFDPFGIIRDVMQNHLLQILSLVTMEQPLGTDAHNVRNRKVEVLRKIAPPGLRDMVLGQYTAGSLRGVSHPGYTEEPSVPRHSLTPTYAETVLCIDTPRWQGVPFTLRAGKGLQKRGSEVQIRFRQPRDNIFCRPNGCPPANQFILRIQPDEGMHLRVLTKEPGLTVKLAETDLNLRYQAAFPTQTIPDAYECLLLDVMEGDKNLFIRSDELAAAWDIFTPVLHEMEARSIRPLPYPFGSEGPIPTPAKDGKGLSTNP